MGIEEFLCNKNNFKTDNETKFLNPLVMAFVGDAVYSLFVKTKELDLFKLKVNDLTKETASIINAKAQEQSLFKVLDKLTEEESDIVKRARNTAIHTKAKNYSIVEYKHATALEALIGYLYLTKRFERLKEIFSIIFEE